MQEQTGLRRMGGRCSKERKGDILVVVRAFESAWSNVQWTSRETRMDALNRSGLAHNAF